MFELIATPKQQKKYFQNKNKKSIPENWEDFAALTNIRSGGEIKQFITYPHQRKLITLGKLSPIVVVLKSRQTGVTQGITAKFLHDSCINPASSNVLFMRNGEDASAVSRRARQMIDSIPDYVDAENDNVGYLKVKGGGDLYFKNSSAEGSRSLDSVTGLLFDEAAFVENISQIYAASSPSSALSGTNIQKYIVSTPSAKSGWYWNILNENNDCDIEQIADDVANGKLFDEIPGFYWFYDKAGAIKVIIHYTAHPVYSQQKDFLEQRQEIDKTDWEVIQREYNLKFIDSSVAVFTSVLVRRGAVGEYESEVDPDASYFLGIDTATTGNDFLCVPVLKYKSGKYSLVHLYRKNHETSQYHLYKIAELIRTYKPKAIGIEVNGAGQVYYEQLVEEFPGYNIEAIKTTGESKPVMIYQLVLALEKEILEYPSKSPVVDELLSFRKDKHKLEAAEGKNDDTVMGLAFALNVSPFKHERQNHFDWEKIESLLEN